MSALLLKSYQKEYETTDITIDELCDKYGITTKDLKGYTKWEKNYAPPVPAVIDHPEVLTTTTPDSAEVQEDIQEFKALAVKQCLNFMRNDAQFAEIKEFKDVVSIMDAIDKSYQKVEAPATNINVLVQNIMQGVEDDC